MPHFLNNTMNSDMWQDTIINLNILYVCVTITLKCSDINWYYLYAYSHPQKDLEVDDIKYESRFKRVHHHRFIKCDVTLVQEEHYIVTKYYS